jgi:hypothetical protein
MIYVSEWSGLLFILEIAKSYTECFVVLHWVALRFCIVQEELCTTMCTREMATVTHTEKLLPPGD